MAGTFTRCSGINNHVSMVMTLLKHGGDVNAKNAADEAPSSLLRVSGLLWYFLTHRDADGSKEMVPTDEYGVWGKSK
ncbi:hypothetical protein CEP54_003051 [Fusarium duplospermum]|uniref:Ankyrin repeat protein n=1 Tax=Fusarium duplospermum TaxID=1325734 RepID=A0A428QQX6_9HYPO|nr:hypothetical protein CEP54_003051 [Fusarium duplospermum]